ncbi:MAG TPA: aldehyde dehydrogenase family protein [Nevskiaceae bacterium]|nr:aldehyde dehydrogenase family protein [Nevskiaceae bacterium]
MNAPSVEQLIAARRGLWVGPRWIREGGAGTFDKRNPATGHALPPVPMMGADEVAVAVDAARAAFPGWRATPASVRRTILDRFAALLESHASELAGICALELGSPVSQGGQLVGLATEWTRYYAGWCDKIEGRTQTSALAPGWSWTRPEPWGIVAVILTWNFPLVSAAMKIVPALAAGNCVVTKLPELAPFGMMRFAELLEEAGLPPGVATFVCGGPDAGAALTRHPAIAKVSFTGGLRTAQAIGVDAAAQVKPLVLELGGKSANLLFADAPLDAAVPMAVAMAMIGAGQGCALPTRLLVERSIYDEVLQRAQAIAQHLPVGDPLAATTVVGPVMTQAACQRILGVIEQAVATRAGRLIAGGTRADGDLATGYFIRPTVFADVDNAASLAQDEIFGPVLSILPFDDEADAIAKANHNAYGLAAFVQTRDVERALRVADELDAGYVSVNGFGSLSPNLPFGGFKQSGYGKEGGLEGLAEFLRCKSVFVGRSATP